MISNLKTISWELKLLESSILYQLQNWDQTITDIWQWHANTFKFDEFANNLCYFRDCVPWWGYALQDLLLLAESRQSCPTLCDPIDGSPPGSPVPGILQTRTLEWGAISFSNAWKWKVKVKPLSRVQLLVTPWTAARQAPPPMGFSRQEDWSGVPSPSPISC